MDMTENVLKGHVLSMAYRQGWAVFHLPATNIRGSQGRGYPDLTFARDREVLWMELKAQKGVLTMEQLAWFDALPAAHVIRPSDWYSGRVAELLA
jgi:hypothetical protein